MGIVVVTDQKSALRLAVIIGLAIPVLGGLMLLGNVLIMSVEEGTWGWLLVALVTALVTWRVRTRFYRIMAILATLSLVGMALFSAISSKDKLRSCARIVSSTPLTNGGKFQDNLGSPYYDFRLTGGTNVPVGTGWKAFGAKADIGLLAECAKKYPDLLSWRPSNLIRRNCSPHSSVARLI